jgi:hypothetical protein
MIHCWEDGPARCRVTGEILDNEWKVCGRHWDSEKPCAIGSTCMLEKDHKGPHQWTPDDGISISFT